MDIHCECVMCYLWENDRRYIRIVFSNTYRTKYFAILMDGSVGLSNDFSKLLHLPPFDDFDSVEGILLSLSLSMTAFLTKKFEFFL